MRLRAGLQTAVVLLGACTAGPPGSPPSETSGAASPTVGASATTPFEPAWLAVDLRFDPDVFFTEGSISFVEVSDPSGELVESDRSSDWRPHFRMQLALGRYDVRTHRRPCDGSCRALDPPRDGCAFSAEMTDDGTNRLFVVRVGRDGACRVADKGDVLDIDVEVSVADLASFTRALTEAGYEADVGPRDRWWRRFFLVPDRAVEIDDHEVHVFEYATVAKRKQISISPDGTGISTKRGLAAIVEWSEPHFFRSGRLLVLFLGDDPIVLETMNLLLGPQFAGR